MTRKAEERILELLTDPQWAAVAAGYLKNLREGFYQPSELVDALMQKSSRQPVDLVDAVVFSKLWAGVAVGLYHHAPIYIGTSPSRNDSPRNNEVLAEWSQSNEWGFSAHFHGAAAYDNDGNFSFESIDLFDTASGELVTYTDGCLPLEVGTTDAITTLIHLHSEYGLARWPYGSERIWVFKLNTNHPDHSYLDFPYESAR